ncbi:MAG: DMT family transporter, partial [Pseudomonadota bacterium]
MFERQLPLNVAFCLILAPVFWGGNFVAGHFLGTALSGPTINLVRWLVALVVLVPLFLPAMMRHWAQVRASWLRLACLGALGVAGFNTVLYEGLRLASVSVAAIAFAVTPLIITVLATVLDRRIPPKRLIVGALIALLGMLAVQADALRAGVAPGGVALVLLAALIWAVYSVALRRGTGALPPGPGFLGQVLFGTMLL